MRTWEVETPRGDVSRNEDLRRKTGDSSSELSLSRQDRLLPNSEPVEKGVCDIRLPYWGPYYTAQGDQTFGSVYIRGPLFEP